MLKGTFKTQYRKQGGKLTFVYTVSGTPEELADYKKVKGEHYREDKDTKVPLFFSQRLNGKNVDIVPVKEGKDFAIDSTKADQLANLQAQGYSYEQAKDMMKEFDS